MDSIKVNDGMEYHDNPIMRIIGNVNSSKIIRNCVSATTLLKDKIVMCFHQFSPYQMFQSGDFFGGYGKDTFYRFDLMPGANWERLQRETAKNVNRDIEEETAKGHFRALIFDDSLYRRTGGKGTELCAKVYDHNDRKLRIGYSGIWNI